MTGRDLIIYILNNNLEDEQICKDGAILGFLTVEQAAAKLDIGVATAYTLISQGRLDTVRIPETKFGYLVPQDCKIKKGE